MKEQIEEMAKVLCNRYHPNCMDCLNCIAESRAEDLYNAGYRKQEWISVEDRLPDVDKVLCWGRTGMWFLDVKVMGESLQTVIDDQGLTHWIPIPEPPEMKGGK